MILISAQDVQKSFGTHEVLKGVSFSLQKGEKMGLVGVNGCGKTTLMRIISGEAEADGGMVHKNRDLRIGYLRQVDDIALTDTVWEALLRVFEPVIAMERRLRELEAQMEQNADPQTALRLTGEYQRLLDRYNEAEGYAYEGEMLGVLNGLGLKPDMHGRKVGTLSGGERTRLSLAKLLCKARRDPHGRAHQPSGPGGHRMAAGLPDGIQGVSLAHQPRPVFSGSRLHHDG